MNRKCTILSVSRCAPRLLLFRFDTFAPHRIAFCPQFRCVLSKTSSFHQSFDYPPLLPSAHSYISVVKGLSFRCQRHPPPIARAHSHCPEVSHLVATSSRLSIARSPRRGRPAFSPASPAHPPHRLARLFLRYTATFAVCPFVAPLAPVNPFPRGCPFPQHPHLFVVCPPLPDVTRSFAEIRASSLSLPAVYMPSYHISPTRLSHRSFVATPLVSRAAVCRDATSSSFAVCFHLISPSLDPLPSCLPPHRPATLGCFYLLPLLAGAILVRARSCPFCCLTAARFSLFARCCHGA